MSDTPRTDDESFDVLDANEEYSRDHSYKNDGEYVNSDFARQLERELTAMTATKNKAVEALKTIQGTFHCFVDLEGEVRSRAPQWLQDLIKELEEVK